MAVLLLLALVLPLILLIVRRVFSQQNKPFQRHRRPPGPRGLPVIGNMHQFDSKTPHLYLWRLSKKYGPLLSLRLASKPVLVVSSAKMASQVMKVHDLECCSRPNITGGAKMSYNGSDIAFSSYNEYWREMRKMCVLHLFNLKRVQSFRPVREDEVSRLMRKVSDLAAADQVMNLSELVMSLTSTFICRIAFGKRLDEEEGGQERRRFHELLFEAQALMGGFYVADYFPSFSWIDKLTGMLPRLEKNFKELDSFYQELIDEHLQPNRPKSMDHDILDLLLRIREDGSFSVDLTWDHVKAVLMNIFIAGTDTGAATIVWAMTALMKAPTAMNEVQTEIRKLVGKKKKKKKEALVDEEDIQNLPYFKAVVKETLRMYPPAPLIMPRETMERFTIDGGYEVEPKTLVYINAWAIARDPEYWENPHEFLPERFMDSPVDFRGQHFELVPFGAGRRGCPGLSLGLATVELVLANLLYFFDWDVPPGMKRGDIDLDALPGLTMHKKIALSLIAKDFAHVDL